MDMIFQIALGVFLGGAMLASLLWSLSTVHRGESVGAELTNWHYLAGLLPLVLAGLILLGNWAGDPGPLTDAQLLEKYGIAEAD